MDWEIQKVIEAAWAEVEPRLRGDPDDLAARLARRRMGIMRRTPRAWCLAVRANDRRMTPMNTAMAPDRPVVWDEENHRLIYREHTVTLDAKLLRWLCRPVSIPSGVEAKELARMLGVHFVTVEHAIRRGTFDSVRYIKGLGGKRGHPVPVVCKKGLLDPAGIPMGRMADAIWGNTWRWLSDHVPDGLEQTLVRRAFFRPCGSELRFRGWRWVCPGCQRLVTHIYYPLPAMQIARFVQRGDDGSVDALADPPGCFACSKCHGVVGYTLLNWQGWNQFIAHVSGGLLYGREVRKPEGLEMSRKRERWTRRDCGSSKRQAQITGFLVDTELSCSQIARRLGVAAGTVQGWVWRIYQRNGVHGRMELRRKLAGEGAGEAQAAG